MFTLFQRLFGSRSVGKARLRGEPLEAREVPASSRRTTRRASSFRPRLEALEERAVPSTSSAAPHAVMQSNGQTAVFYISELDHSFYEAEPGRGVRQLTGPYVVQKFSAGLDSSGRADVFAEDVDGSFWCWNNYHAWQPLMSSDNMGIGDFAAVKGGRAYVQMSDASVVEAFVDAPYWWTPGVQLFSMFDSGTVVGSNGVLDAVTDYRGYDAIFAKKYDGSLREYYRGNWHFVEDAGALPGFSAGTDANGNPDVFYQYNDGTFKKWDNGIRSQVWGPGLVTQFSATNNGQVWVIDSNGHLDKFDASNYLQRGFNGSGTLSISAASSNDVFFVFDSIYGKTLYELQTQTSPWNENPIDVYVQSS
jgi:hypothetical protein